MTVMADRSGRPAPVRRRMKTLTQAALNADKTVEQVEDVLDGLGKTMAELNSSLSQLNSTVEALGGRSGPSRRYPAQPGRSRETAHRVGRAGGSHRRSDRLHREPRRNGDVTAVGHRARGSRRVGPAPKPDRARADELRRVIEELEVPTRSRGTRCSSARQRSGQVGRSSVAGSR